METISPKSPGIGLSGQGRGMATASRAAYVPGGGEQPLYESLYASSEGGAAFEPNVLSSLYQDEAGTVPVTTVGQNVMRMNDLSGNGNHAIMTRTNRIPTLGQSGGRYHLVMNGAQCMEHPAIPLNTLSAHIAATITGNAGVHRALWSQRQGVAGDILYADDGDAFSYWSGDGTNWNELAGGAAVLNSPFVASMIRSGVHGKGIQAPTAWATTALPAHQDSRQFGRIFAGSDGPPVKPVVSATPKGTIPSTTVSLATYGGVPGASSAVNRQALLDAFAAIRTAGGGTITIPPGTYDMGSGTNGYLLTLDLCDNVMFDAYGATFTFASNSGGVPVLMFFAQCNNINIYGLKFVDTTSDMEVTNHGLIAVGYGGFNSQTFSGFKMYDCEGEGLLSLFRTEDGGHGVSDISIHATLTQCYYGINNSNNGRNSEAFLVTNGCRRALIMQGTSDWNIVVDHTPHVNFQSNSFVSLYTSDAAASSVEDMNLWLTVRGNMAYHNGALGLQHQAESTSSSPPLHKNIYVHFEVVNLTSIASLVWFVSYEPSIVGTTARLWENIVINGTVDSGSASTLTGNLVNSQSASSGASSVKIADTLEPYQSLSGLPSYFELGEIGTPGFYTPGLFHGAYIIDRDLTEPELIALRAHLGTLAGV